MTTADQRQAAPELARVMLDADARMRQGRSIGRTLYLQARDEPSNDDLCVGLMDSPDLAAYVARAVNHWRGL